MTMQEHYQAMMDKLTPFMPEKGKSPEEYSGALQAFLTCAVNIGMCCYHVDHENGRLIVQRAYTFIGKELEAAPTFHKAKEVATDGQG